MRDRVGADFDEIACCELLELRHRAAQSLGPASTIHAGPPAQIIERFVACIACAAMHEFPKLVIGAVPGCGIVGVPRFPVPMPPPDGLPRAERSIVAEVDVKSLIADIEAQALWK